MGDAVYKPCPFCGHPVARVFEDGFVNNEGKAMFRTHCPGCEASGPSGETEEAAAKLWAWRWCEEHREESDG